MAHARNRRVIAGSHLRNAEIGLRRRLIGIAEQPQSAGNHGPGDHGLQKGKAMRRAGARRCCVAEHPLGAFDRLGLSAEIVERSALQPVDHMALLGAIGIVAAGLTALAIIPLVAALRPSLRVSA